MANETLSLVLIVVGTVALLSLMTGTPCYSGESYHKHSSTCGCPSGMKGGWGDTPGFSSGVKPQYRKDGLITGRDSMITGRDSMITGRDSMITGRDSMITGRDSMITGRDSMITGRDNFNDKRRGRKDKSRNSNCPYADDGDIPAEYARVNYQDAIKGMALEADVQSSHSTWIDNITHTTTSASKDSVRDDPNDINPWVGLRRPKYKTRSQPLAESRVIPSDIPCNMSDHSGSYCI
jgi:hypothetical protein